MKIKDLKEQDLLYRDLESRIDSIKSKQRLYNILHKTTRIVVFFAGAAITILTGWRITNVRCNFNPDNAVLIISTCITLLAALEGLFAFKDKGKSYDIFLFELRRLRDRICFDYINNPDIYKKNRENHFNEFQKILESQKAIIEISDPGEN